MSEPALSSGNAGTLISKPLKETVAAIGFANANKIAKKSARKKILLYFGRRMGDGWAL
jgi:hypothetical protein